MELLLITCTIWAHIILGSRASINNAVQWQIDIFIPFVSAILILTIFTNNCLETIVQIVSQNLIVQFVEICLKGFRSSTRLQGVQKLFLFGTKVKVRPDICNKQKSFVASYNIEFTSPSLRPPTHTQLPTTQKSFYQKSTVESFWFFAVWFKLVNLQVNVIV